jgi:hypothetical protein
MARARGGHASRFLMPTGASSTWEMAPDWLVLQRFSRVERVTGIEPALSAWELFELMGMCLVLCGFRGPERTGVSLGRLP